MTGWALFGVLVVLTVLSRRFGYRQGYKAGVRAERLRLITLVDGYDCSYSVDYQAFLKRVEAE